MKKIFGFSALTFITGALILILSACGHHRHDPEEKAEWLNKKITRKLDLGADQQAKLKDVTDVFVKHHKERKSTRKQHMDTLLGLVTQEQIEPQAFQDIFDDHQQSMAAAAPEFFSKLSVFHASLNEEQKRKLAKKLEKFMKYHHDED
ncbi:MAG: Spy/CpxP family protein refolding chaperone [Gammaproteobacteria bacterium]|nr:Spy/CpxP family protein refolding chaperone [Gammaproteobacteria bacterium]